MKYKISYLIGLFWFGVIFISEPMWTKIIAAILGVYNLIMLFTDKKAS